MRRILVAVAFATLVLSLPVAPAHAQATRTWVSGVGDDANPCSRTAPCKTWAGAISKTANGGEIDALDPGGFGALTITKSITLDGGGGQVASVLVAGTNGIVVAAQPTDIVTIRNVRFDGLLGNGSNSANAGINGIRFISGAKLEIESVNIFGFNASCVDVELSAAAAVEIRNSTLVNCKTAGVNVITTGGVSVNVFVKNSVLWANGTGAVSNGSNTSVLLSGNVITANGTGLTSTNGGTLFGYHTNEINANGTPGTAVTPVSQQ